MTEQPSFKIKSIGLAIFQVLKRFKAVLDFQREHVWECEQVEKLPEDMLNEYYNENCGLIEGPKYFRRTQLKRAMAALIQFGSRNQTVAERQKMLTALARKVWDMPTPGRVPEA